MMLSDRRASTQLSKRPLLTLCNQAELHDGHEIRPQLRLNLARHHTSPRCQVNVSKPDKVMPYFAAVVFIYGCVDLVFPSQHSITDTVTSVFLLKNRVHTL